jgi:hypothetical protein
VLSDSWMPLLLIYQATQCQISEVSNHKMLTCLMFGHGGHVCLLWVSTPQSSWFCKKLTGCK